LLFENLFINFKTELKMKNLDLAAYEVVEMNEVEMNEVDGGLLFLVPVVVVALALSSCSGTKVTVSGEYKGAKGSVEIER